jgi:hypothetical protein
MVIVTTFIAPLWLRSAFERQNRAIDNQTQIVSEPDPLLDPGSREAWAFLCD